jgi:hypothetical protein
MRWLLAAADLHCYHGCRAGQLVLLPAPFRKAAVAATAHRTHHSSSLLFYNARLTSMVLLAHRSEAGASESET